MTDQQRFARAIRAYCNDEITPDELHAIAIDTGHSAHSVLAAIDAVTAEGLRDMKRRQRNITIALILVAFALIGLSMVVAA